MTFVDSVTASGKIDEEWRAFVDANRTAELDDIITQEGLNPEETKKFIERAFRDGTISTAGTAVTKILPPVSRFSSDGGHGVKKQHVLARLRAYLERFLGLGSNGEDND